MKARSVAMAHSTGQPGTSNTPSQAQPADGGAIALDEISVAAQQPTFGTTGFVATRSTAGMKGNDSILETPATVSVITREELDVRGVQDLNTAVAYTPNVQAVDYPGGQGGPTFTLRGFNANNFDNVYEDGLRYGFNSGITVSEEVSRLLFVYLTFLGAIVAVRERLHLGFDSLVRSLPPAAQRACAIVAHLLMLLATGVFLIGSWQQAVINLGVKTPVTGASMALYYGVGVVFCVSVALMLLVDLARLVSGRVSAQDLVTLNDSAEAAVLPPAEKSTAVA